MVLNRSQLPTSWSKQKQDKEVCGDFRTGPPGVSLKTNVERCVFAAAGSLMTNNRRYGAVAELFVLAEANV